jgi:hypothetical protein
MKTPNVRLSHLVASLVFVPLAAIAQTNVSSTDKFSWSENCGWMNWADAGSPTGTQGALIAGSFGSGFVWMENTGWVNLGDGTPGNGVSYANATGADFGLNISGDGSLSGLAWGENIGWINFTLPTLPVVQRPRLDIDRLRGYAWGENIGWINLDDANHFVAIESGACSGCAADYNQDGGIDGSDVQAFFADWENAAGCSDVNQDGGIDGADVGAFFDVWEAGGC